MSKIDVTAPGKLLALCIIIVGCIAFIITSQFQGTDTTPAWATITLITGYLIGNGVGAARGQDSTPIFKSIEEDGTS